MSRKKKILIVGGPIAAFLLLTPLLTYAFFARDIADPERLMNRSNTGVVILDRKGKPFYRTGRAEHRKITKLNQISDAAEKALISAEDKDFYKHSGFSVGSMLAALYANFINADATGYGGSTLTQQLAKITLLSTDQNFLRKYQELSIAIAIEQNYTKDEILELYLNSAYFGEGAFGIKEAAKAYFNKEPANLNLAESAMLIGVLPAPSAYSPITGDRKLAKERQETVLERMRDNGVIDAGEKESALKQPLAYAPAKTAPSSQAPHFAEMVLEELYERYGEEKVTRSGYQVRTGLDLDLQQRAVDKVNEHLPIIQQGGGSNAGVVAIDPRNGHIRALVGSIDWENKEFGKVNMAITPRQPGSSFKPVYFTEALNKRKITPATILRDEATDFGGYKPNNFDFQFRGDITVRNALGQSLNIPAVKVMQKLGVNTAVTAAERMGISTLEDPGRYGLSLALGAAETKLLEMTNVYAAFANKGMQYKPVAITSIEDKYDERIYRAEDPARRVMGEGASFLISDILSDNVARAPTFGSSLTIPGYDVAVKTGTTDDERDAWTIGYTPNIAIGVWVGNNDNRTMTIGGSGMAGPIWMGAMLAALENTNPVAFSRPSGVEEVMLCRANGLRASNPGGDVYTEFFLSGTAPTSSCDVPRQQEQQQRPPSRQREEAPQPEEEPEETPTPTPTPDPDTETPPEPDPEIPLPDDEEETPTQP